jgi:hypothetical protein
VLKYKGRNLDPQLSPSIDVTDIVLNDITDGDRQSDPLPPFPTITDRDRHSDIYSSLNVINGEIYVLHHLFITNSGRKKKRQDVRNGKYRVFGKGGAKRRSPDKRL